MCRIDLAVKEEQATVVERRINYMILSRSGWVSHRWQHDRNLVGQPTAKLWSNRRQWCSQTECMDWRLGRRLVSQSPRSQET